VKPENILLDEEMRPRVADFGLAKLMRRDQSYRVTNMRGTIGYMGPEWVKYVPITEKSDVFSFGIVLLELVSGRRHFDLSLGEGEKRLPAWAFSLLEKNGRNALLEIVDKSLQLSQTSNSMHEDQEEEELQLQQQACLNMILVALWCIQEEISLRPTMGTVLKMLEGDADIVDPPVCSYFFLDSGLGSPSAAASSSSSSSASAGGATSSSTANEVQIAFTSTQESQITEVLPR
jgi:serine/threonine protein kinase